MAGKPKCQNSRKQELATECNELIGLSKYDQKCMKVQEKHGKVTQNMHGASRNYRYFGTYHQYFKTIASYYFKENNNFNYLLSNQDTELSATGKLSNKIKHATYRKFNLRQKKSSRKTKALQLNRATAKKKKEQLTAKRISMQIL